MKISEEEIEAGKSSKGGFTRATLAKWGVPWPPRAGWREALVAGEPIPGAPAGNFASPSTIRKRPDGTDIDPAVLLHQVVMEIITAGHGDLLNEIEDLHDYLGSRIPTVAEVIGEHSEVCVITGGITLDDRVYRFECARRVR